jgi:hypothetical protein
MPLAVWWFPAGLEDACEVDLDRLGHERTVVLARLGSGIDLGGGHRSCGLVADGVCEAARL